MNKAILAIDMGGSKYMVGLVTPSGEVLAKERFAWTSLDGETILPQIESSARKWLAGAPEVELLGIGATIPGLADAKSGTWLEASFSGIRNLPVAEALAKAFELPAYADNDGQACALAEKRFGSAKDCKDFVYVTVSNGVGGAAFVGNRLLQGSTGSPVELGHCCLVPDGRPCKCGMKGCVEAYAAGPGLIKTYLECGGQEAEGLEIVRRARAFEPEALEAFRREGEYLGLGLSWAINLFNAEKVIIGGGLSLAFDLFGAALVQALERRVYHTANPSVTVEPTRLGYEGALLGAAAVCLCRMANQYYDFEK